MVVVVGIASSNFISVLNHASTGQKHQADGPEEDKFQSIPDAEEYEQVEPSGTAIMEPAREDCRSEEVGGSEEHDRYAPLQPVPRSKPTEEQVGGRVMEECVEGYCQSHGDGEHEDVLSD